MSSLLRRQPQTEAQRYFAQTRPPFALIAMVVAPGMTALASAVVTLLAMH